MIRGRLVGTSPYRTEQLSKDVGDYVDFPAVPRDRDRVSVGQDRYSVVCVVWRIDRIGGAYKGSKATMEVKVS